MTSKETPENTDSGRVPELQEMSAADIKAAIAKQKEGKLIELPVSGLTVRVGRPTISRMLREDVFPAELVALAIDMDSDKLDVKTKDEYLRSVDVMDAVAIYASITPKLVKTEEEVKEGENSLWVQDLHEQDRFAIYMFAQTGVEPLRKFRDEQQREDAGPDMPKVPESKA